MTHQFFVHYKPLQHQSSGHMPAARAPTKENHASPTHPNLDKPQINGLSRAINMIIPRQIFYLTWFCYLLSQLLLMPHSRFNCVLTCLFCCQQLGIEDNYSPIETYDSPFFYTEPSLSEFCEVYPELEFTQSNLSYHKPIVFEPHELKYTISNMITEIDQHSNFTLFGDYPSMVITSTNFTSNQMPDGGRILRYDSNATDYDSYFDVPTATKESTSDSMDHPSHSPGPTSPPSPSPTRSPTDEPSSSPTKNPTPSPTRAPSREPTKDPS
eukprot:1007446_1